MQQEVRNFGADTSKSPLLIILDIKVTGYIGGDAIYAIVQAHPEYEITCLVRNSDKGAKVAKEHSSIKLVYGDLDSVDLIEAESKKADIVLSEFGIWYTACDTQPNKFQTSPTQTTKPPSKPS